MTRAPDLLFEEECDARIRDVAHLLESPENIGIGDPLHRLTVFLTYACNLACPYCKTIPRGPPDLLAHPQKRLRYDRVSFAALLDAHEGTPLRHLHFTGGEAAIVPGVKEMVRLARDRGVGAISMTSNGTLGAPLYLALVDAGLHELRISLDADAALLGEELTGRRGAFAATVATLEGLARARRGGADFTLVLNAVIGLENRRRLPELVSFLLGFEPSDVKLITEVDRRDELGAFDEAPAILETLRAMLDGYPADALPLLRRKIETVFSPDSIGIRSAESGWRCYIPLTERTADRSHYYPCSVYLREGGAPLGRLSDPPGIQRLRTAAFVRDSDCTTDPICRRYCLHCTRKFNDAANEARVCTS